MTGLENLETLLDNVECLSKVETTIYRVKDCSFDKAVELQKWVVDLKECLNVTDLVTCNMYYDSTNKCALLELLCKE